MLPAAQTPRVGVFPERGEAFGGAPDAVGGDGVEIMLCSFLLEALSRDGLARPAALDAVVRDKQSAGKPTSVVEEALGGALGSRRAVVLLPAFGAPVLRLSATPSNIGAVVGRRTAVESFGRFV